jgi:hypothetical protein
VRFPERIETLAYFLLRRMTGGLIMSIAYGIDVLPMNDPYLKLLQESMHGLAEARVSGKYLVASVGVLSISLAEGIYRMRFRF